MNYDAFVRYAIPTVRQRYEALDAVRYALSIGLGQNPMDEWQLQFVDDHKGPTIVPSFCVVLGHPGLWQADPATTIDSTRLVHAEEGFRLVAPLPTSGHVVGATRIVDVIDKGRDKGALVYLEKDLRHVETGTLIATETRTLMLRGDGGYGGPSGPARAAPTAPSVRPDHVVEIPIRPEQALFYRLNGDPNPLHLDPAEAARAGFPKPILHGLCTFGIACNALLRTLVRDAPARLTGMSARFSAPVYPGETLRVEVWSSGAFQAKVVERDILVLSFGQALID